METDDLEREALAALDDPAFARWLQTRLGGSHLHPDEQDIDPAAQPSTSAEASEFWRLAEARKLVRLYQEWKAALE